jgi:hypothetical protein
MQDKVGYLTTATLKEILHELDPKLTEEELIGIIGTSAIRVNSSLYE